jgi:hypothetical protein
MSRLQPTAGFLVISYERGELRLRHHPTRAKAEAEVMRLHEAALSEAETYHESPKSDPYYVIEATAFSPS